MEDKRHFALIAGVGCMTLVIVLVIVIGALFFLPEKIYRVSTPEPETAETSSFEREVTREVEPVPTLTVPPTSGEGFPTSGTGVAEETLASLYEEINPGVVNIRVYVERGGLTGEGAGSGFILDEEGHIITNNHVVAGADEVTVIFHNGIEVRAEIMGTDGDSDLAVIKVDELPEGVHPLNMSDSGQVKVGQWVVAIGNPFSLGGSMTLGIVSAVGRAIPSGATRFRIPQAIQTDAAINPGNSGGPLLNLQGEVIGVNAQIASGGTQANAGVGFAIPSSVVRRVVPALIEGGAYTWPWLGVTGGDVNLLIQEANDLDSQQGAYIAEVVSGSPAAEAGLQGATGAQEINGREVPIGGDVIVEMNGESIADFTDLLSQVAFRNPGDEVELAIIRDGERRRITVTLAARPEDFGS